METRRLWMMWWSGLFAAATFVHLLRALTALSVSVGEVSVPLWVSWVVFPAAGLVSLWLVRRARGVG